MQAKRASAQIFRCIRVLNQHAYLRFNQSFERALLVETVLARPRLAFPRIAERARGATRCSFGMLRSSSSSRLNSSRRRPLPRAPGPPPPCACAAQNPAFAIAIMLFLLHPKVGRFDQVHFIVIEVRIRRSEDQSEFVRNGRHRSAARTGLARFAPSSQEVRDLATARSACARGGREAPSIPAVQAAC